MRWQALFRDLEAQFEQAQDEELLDEASQRARVEVGKLRLADRLRAVPHAPLVLELLGAGRVQGRVVDVGPDWLLLDEGGGREALVPLAALLGVSGLARAVAGDEPGEVAKRLDLRWALRGLARSRATVVLVLRDGSSVGGTIDRVAADHIDLAEHPAGEPRRASAVSGVRAVPLSALALARAT